MDFPFSIAPRALDALNAWAPIVWLKLNPYAYPTLEIVHILGIALLFGTLWIVDLAILGHLRVFEVNLLARHLLPWTLTGFVMAALSGVTMFLAGVADLIGNTAFVLKMCLLFVAASNAAVLYARGRINTASPATRLQALLSIALWIAIVASGRWIGYL